jgi:ABC-type Na+ efflux pump permease subunit
MNKILIVARREFVTTVMTRAFLLGLILPPALMFLGIAISVAFSTDRAPAVKGSVAIIDRSGVVVDAVRARFTPEGLREVYREDAGEQIKKVAEGAAEQAAKGPADPSKAVSGQVEAVQAVSSLGAKTPELTLEVLAPDASAEVEKQALSSWTVDGGGRLMLVVIEPQVVAPEAGGAGAGGTGATAGRTYQVFTAPKLDPRVVRPINAGVIHKAVVDARLRGAGLDPERVERLMSLGVPRAAEVTKQGERKGTAAAQFIIPLVFFMLVWIGAFSGAGQLLNNTIEEKSNRIMEVLLSAVSPFELMAGKILGQLGAGLVIVGVYAGAGVFALVALAYADMITWWQIAWMMVFFVVAYLFIASVFTAIGSAVSDIQEANSLMAPAMLLIMIPMFAVFPIVQNPTGTLAKVLSFVPPFSPFAMIARVGSNQPPAQWVILLSALVSVVAAVGAVWCASKIFRIGVLLYGKPPNLLTLLRWVRMS